MPGEILCIGLSHHTAPLDVRERLSVATEHMGEELEKLIGEGTVEEGILVSTCNRVELYAAAADPRAASRRIKEYLQERTGDDVSGYLYERLGREAVQHAFRVASSLDSMVVGEPQILGQMKNAFSAAHGAGGVGMLLGRCFHRAFAVAKQVRTQTGIAAGTVSVSSIAIELAQKIFGDLAGRRALLVGAGKMSEAAARSLAKRGAQMYVVNRSTERARQLAGACGGQARGYDQLESELTAADVVISSTASPDFVITEKMMKSVVKARRRRTLFLIDIALPRDVDPKVSRLDGVFLYDIDDLQQVAQENLAARRKEASQAEKLVAVETEQFEAWRRSLTLTPTVVALRERFRDVLRSELERTMPRLKNLSDKEKKSLDKMVDAMVNKLLHQPLTQMKQSSTTPEGALLIDAARRLFDLPAAEEQSEGAGEVVRGLAHAGSRGGEGR